MKERFIKIIKKGELFDSEVLSQFNELQTRLYPSRIKFMWPEEELYFSLNAISEDDSDELQGCLEILNGLSDLELASHIAGFVRIRKMDADSEELDVFQYIQMKFAEIEISF